MVKKKWTKKELKKLEKEKKLKEEEERKIKEEKEREEEEIKQKILEEKLKKEEEILKKQELERLMEEEKDLKKNWDFLISNEKSLALKLLNEKLEWDNFLKTNGKPNPQNIIDINTCQSEFNDLKIEKPLDYNWIYEKIEELENLNKQMEIIHFNYLKEDNFKLAKEYKNFIKNGRNLIIEKIEEISSDYLQNCEKIIEKFHDDLKKEKEKNKNIDQNKDIITFYKNHQFIIGYYIFLDKNSLRMKHIDFYQNMITVYPPRTIFFNKIVIRPLWVNFDYLSNNNYLGEFMLGGVLDLSIYKYRGEQEKLDNFKIKYYYTENELRERIQNLENDNSSSNTNIQILKLSYFLPDNILITDKEKIKVYNWDSEHNTWNSDYITKLTFNEDAKIGKKIVNVVIQKITPIALFQDKNIDFPYKSFELRNIGNNVILLDIKTNRFDLTFKFEESYVSLINRDEVELKDIVNKKLFPHDLIYQLKQSGIYLIPEDDDFSKFLVNYKSFEAEKKLISDMKMMVKYFYIKSTRWNQSLPKDQQMIKIKENLECDKEFLEDQEKDWVYLKYWKNKCTVCNANDELNKLDYSTKEGFLTHSNFYILLNNYNIANEEIKNKYTDIDNILVVDCLEKFLKITRLVSFSLG